MRVLITSPGGMGSTNLAVELKARGVDATDVCDLKHAFPDNPRIDKLAPHKVIYVWNDPLLSILSLHRRGILEGVYRYMNSQPKQFETLEQFWNLTLEEDKDIFGSTNHFHAWLGSSLDVFIFDWRRFSQDNLEEFLEVESNLFRLKKSQRYSYDLNNIPKRIREIYEELDKEVKSYA